MCDLLVPVGSYTDLYLFLILFLLLFLFLSPGQNNPTIIALDTLKNKHTSNWTDFPDEFYALLGYKRPEEHLNPISKSHMKKYSQNYSANLISRITSQG